MSLKKDNFTNFDKRIMRFAINLAYKNNGLTGVNPSVGCVIVKEDQIISTGQTGYNGRPHAEYNAIKSCKKNLKDSIKRLNNPLLIGLNNSCSGLCSTSCSIHCQ